jgi:hypothetical protein
MERQALRADREISPAVETAPMKYPMSAFADSVNVSY